MITTKFWRASQGSNLEPSDLESDALPIGATDPFSVSTRARDLPASLPLSNFAFFVYGVGAASRTEFLDRKLVGLRLLVLGGRVVARFAGLTRKRNQISHYNTPRKISFSVNRRRRANLESPRRDSNP